MFFCIPYESYDDTVFQVFKYSERDHRLEGF